MSRAAEKTLQCWKCGADVSGARLPVAREERCPSCGADLHVCRMCRHYAPHSFARCDEDRAEGVMDKERANFCDWFAPRSGAFVAGSHPAAGAARARLESLFGVSDRPASKEDRQAQSSRALEELFKKPSG